MAAGHVADSNIIVDATAAPVSASVTLTVAGGHSNNLLVATVCWIAVGPTVSSVVWDSAGANQSFTSMGTALLDDSSVHFNLQKFYLVNPTPGASKLVTVTMSTGVSAIGLVAAHFDGVDQSTPIRSGTYRNDGTASVAITSAVGDMTVSSLVCDAFSGSAPTTNKTLIGSNFNGSIGFAFGLDYASGAATVTHTWSATFFSVTESMGASLAAASGSGTTPLTFTGSDNLAGGELL